MPGTHSDIVIIIVSASVAFLILVIFIIWILLIHKNKQLLNEVEVKNMTDKYHQEILQARLEMQEQTLTNISEEIHDNFGQVLSVVVLNLSAVDISDQDPGAIQIHKSINLVKKVISELRNLSKMLDRDNFHNTGLAAFLKNELEMLEKTGTYQTSFNRTGEEIRLEPSQEIIIYRIVQESLNNVIKHAKAKKLEISIEFSKETITITITDDGIGFEIERSTMEGPPRNGAGLKNMRKRASIIGAELKIDSSVSMGTNIVLKIPAKTA
jgi:two-component system, NarL family, sensor kinase